MPRIWIFFFFRGDDGNLRGFPSERTTVVVCVVRAKRGGFRGESTRRELGLCFSLVLPTYANAASFGNGSLEWITGNQRDGAHRKC